MKQKKKNSKNSNSSSSASGASEKSLEKSSSAPSTEEQVEKGVLPLSASEDSAKANLEQGQTSSSAKESAVEKEPATILLPAEAAAAARNKLGAMERAPLRRINELAEQESLTPTVSHRDFLTAGNWAGEGNPEQSDGQPPPRVARISFSEPPEELALLDFEAMQLPPMDPTAKPSTSRYSLHFLLTSAETLPPVSEFCPRQALMAMRDGPEGNFTAGFLERTGLAIPPELDPDIPSRRESNLSSSDWDADQDPDDPDADIPAPRGVGVPPASPATPARGVGGRSSESTAARGEERAGAGLDHARLVSALGALAECGDEDECPPDDEDDRARPAGGSGPPSTALPAPAPSSASAPAAAVLQASPPVAVVAAEAPISADAKTVGSSGTAAAVTLEAVAPRATEWAAPPLGERGGATDQDGAGAGGGGLVVAGMVMAAAVGLGFLLLRGRRGV